LKIQINFDSTKNRKRKYLYNSFFIDSAMALKKKASASLCSSCKKREVCDYFKRYANSDSDNGFAIEIMECDDFKQ